MKTYLENARSERSPPSIQQVVLSGAREPLAAVSELEGEDATLVQVELVLVRFRVVQHFHVAALHAARDGFEKRRIVY